MTTFEQFFDDNPEQKTIYEKEYKESLLSEVMLEKMAEDDRNAIQETLYLNSIPGMYDSLKGGMETPLDDCLSEEDVF